MSRSKFARKAPCTILCPENTLCVLVIFDPDLSQRILAEELEELQKAVGGVEIKQLQSGGIGIIARPFHRGVPLGDQLEKLAQTLHREILKTCGVRSDMRRCPMEEAQRFIQ